MIEQKLDFPRMLRDLRMERGLRQREVAKIMGITTSSYGNVESMNRKCVRLDKVVRLARAYGLDESATAALKDAWEALPVSEYSAKQRKSWDERNAARSKSKRFDSMRLALVELIGFVVGRDPDPESLCGCRPDDDFGSVPPCEVCVALQAVGLPGWSTRDGVIAELTKLQDTSS